MTGAPLDPDAIETHRLILTPLRVDDADEMVGVLADPSLYAVTGGRPLSRGELRLRYAKLATRWSPDGAEAWLNWIVRLRDSGAAIGTVQATVGAERATIAWVVGVPWQRRGFASEAARALVGWLETCGVAEVSANIHPGHLASQRVAAAAGLWVSEERRDGEEVWRR